MDYGTPDFARFDIQLMGTLYDFTTENGAPNFLQSFEMSKYADSIALFSFKIHNAWDDDLEEKLLYACKNFDDESVRIRVRYGWQNNMSEWFTGLLYNYTSDFTEGMTQVFTVSALLAESPPRKDTKSFTATSVKDLAQKVADSEGWTLNFVGEDATFAEKTFTQTNESAIGFLSNSETGAFKDYTSPQGSHYYCYLDTSKSPAQLVVSGVNINGNNIVVRPEHNYVVNIVNNGNDRVLSFSCSYSGFAIGAIKSLYCSVDPATGNLIVSEEDKPNYNKQFPKNTLTNQLDVAAMPPEVAQALSTHDFYDEQDAVYKSTIAVYGDVYVKPMDYINILVIKRNGRKHMSSGTYFVTEVKHNIDGIFKTTISGYQIPGEEFQAAWTGGRI